MCLSLSSSSLISLKNYNTKQISVDTWTALQLANACRHHWEDLVRCVPQKRLIKTKFTRHFIFLSKDENRRPTSRSVQMAAAPEAATSQRGFMLYAGRQAGRQRQTLPKNLVFNYLLILSLPFFLHLCLACSFCFAAIFAACQLREKERNVVRFARKSGLGLKARQPKAFNNGSGFGHIIDHIGLDKTQRRSGDTNHQ